MPDLFEKQPTMPQEEGPEVTRQEVVNAYTKFVEQGVTNPDRLDLKDPKVQEASRLFDRWQEQENKRVGSEKEAMLRSNVSRSMLYVDAGFTDPDYLDEVLNDWLVQDEETAAEEENNPEREETRRQIKEAMKKIENLL